MLSARAKLIIILLFVVCVGFILGLYYHRLDARRSTYTHKAMPAAMLPAPKAITQFHLIDDKQQSFSQQQLLGHWSVLFFGFTHCQGICPTTMSQLAKFWQRVHATSGLALPQIVMISIDPRRDDAQTMGRYVHSFNPAFIGVTGAAQEIKRVSRQFYIAYAEQPSVDGQISHSGALLLVDPKGRLRAVFTSPHQSLFADFAAIVTA